MCKALCKDGSRGEAGVIVYVAKSFKFFSNYVVRAKNVVNDLDYVLRVEFKPARG